LTGIGRAAIRPGDPLGFRAEADSMTTAIFTICFSFALPDQGLFNRPAQQHNKFGSGTTPMQREGKTQFSGEGVYSPQYGSLNPANGAGAPPASSAVGGGVPGAMTPYVLGQAGAPRTKPPAPFYTFGPNPAPAEAVGGMVVRGQLPAPPLPGELPPGVIVSNQPYIRYQTPGGTMPGGGASVSLQPGPSGFAPMPAGQGAPVASLPMTSQATVWDRAINGYRPASQPVAPVVPPGWVQAGVGAGPYPGNPNFQGAGQVVGTLGPNTINPAATPGVSVIPGDLSWGQPRMIQLPPGVVVGSNLPLSAVSGRTTGSVFIATAPPPGVGGAAGGPAPAAAPGARMAAADPGIDPSVRTAATFLSEDVASGRAPSGMAVDARTKVAPAPPGGSEDAGPIGGDRRPTSSGPDEPLRGIPPNPGDERPTREAGRSGLGGKPTDGKPERLKGLPKAGDGGELPDPKPPVVPREEALPDGGLDLPPSPPKAAKSSTGIGRGLELVPPGKSGRDDTGPDARRTPLPLPLPPEKKAATKANELPPPVKDKPAPGKPENDSEENDDPPPPPRKIGG
jgi:hypothetical protein